MSTTVTHVAGPELTVHGRYLRQRCSWCGALLLDYDLAAVARPLEQGEDPENPKPWKPATFELGGLVRFDGAGQGTSGATYMEAVDLGEHEDGAGRLPPDACAMLDPAVTA